MSVEDLPLPSPPPDPNLRGHMSGLFSRALADKITPNVFSDLPDSEGDSAGRKKVGFHPWTTNILEPQLSTPDSEIPPSLKSLPPSRDCQLNVRPILKPSLSSQSILGLDGHNEKVSSLANMDSLLRNLAVNERSSSVDAYQTMSSLIRTYDEAPEQEILQRKMAQLQKHIRRDLVVLDVQTDSLPSEDRLGMGNLIMSALKVLVTVVWSPAYSPCLTDEFRGWVVDRAIRVLKDHSAPKAVLLHYMHLLATQNFRSSIVTQSRVQRVLEVLQELTEYISGKAVVAERLLVYQKLVQQSKQFMKVRPEMWIKNIFTAMGHSFKEVRTNAVSAGTEACTAYAGTSNVVAAARAALAEVNGHRTLSVSITNRLERVLAAKDEANQIPQIWTLVLLLCNGGQQRIDSWEQLHDWLKLIQRCFNSSDATVRVQAFLAWNRLYYIARPHEASEKIVSMLAKPATVQLDKTGSAQLSKSSRQAVVSSYCMLLYYAFRPSATSVQYTRMWNEFVVKFMTRSFLSKSGSNCDLSCRILAALFHSSLSKTRIWNENRAHENAALDPLELPAIDCKWIRSKTPAILSIFQLVVEYSSFGPSGTFSDQAYAPKAWRHLMQAVKESTSKEIKPSNDTKSALSSIIRFLRPDSNEIEATPDDVTENYQKLSLLATIAIEELGFSVILQTVKDTHESLNTIVVKSLIHHALHSTDGSLTQPPYPINDCLHILSEDLKSTTQANSAAEKAEKCLILQCIEDVVGKLGKIGLSDLLSKLQESLAALVEDANEQFLEDNELDCHATAHRRLCDLVFILYDSTEPVKQKELSALLSAAASSTHAWIRDFGSARQGASKSSNTNQMASSIAASLSLRASHRDSIAGLGDADLDQAAKFELGQISIASDAKSTASKSRKTRSKPRHDDSQIVFVPVESSPPKYTSESQLLTTRQKEVRARQLAESALTFATICSSPTNRHKETPRTDRQLRRSDSKKLPGTPTLTLPVGNEDEEQPPTPTPRARKSRRVNVQPEITSSPPSISGDGNNDTGINITSSPVKDTVEADDALSFEAINNSAADNEHSEPAVTLGKLEDRTLSENQEDLSTRPAEKSNIRNGPAPSGSTVEEYETAEPDRSSPTTYSDEFDALAASQLSQNLEETSFMTSHGNDEAIISQSRTTRKRRGESRDDSSSKKRRRSSVKDEKVLKTGSKPEVSVDDMEDTIYVSVERTTPSSLRVTRARAAQEVSESSQISQRSSASSTPGSKKASGSRKRGRPRRKTRSQTSRDASPSSRVESTTASTDEQVDENSKIDVEMEEAQIHVTPPSLGSEVEETDESKLPNNDPSEVTIAQVIGESPVSPQDLPAAKEDLGGVEVLDLGSPQGTSDAPTTLPIDVVGNLQNILDGLNNPTIDTKTLDLDLATIHSLCFKIGLKAQELATR